MTYKLKNKTATPLPIALPGRAIHLAKRGDTALVSNREYKEPTVQALLRLRKLTATELPGDLEDSDEVALEVKRIENQRKAEQRAKDRAKGVR